MINVKNTIFFIFAVLTSLIILVNLKTTNQGLVVDIKPGSSLKEISINLEENNIISSSLLFILYAKALGRDKEIKAGEYLFLNKESINTAQLKLIKGDIYYRKLQLKEGMTIKDVLNLAHEAKGIVDDIKRDTELLNEKINRKGQFEGMLYPDTYYYKKGDKFSSILLRAFEKQTNLYDLMWKERKKGLPYNSFLEALTLASIIEKEGLEKRQIAGVFINRLHKNMKLQSDPTVIFALGEKFDGNIRRKDLTIKHPYNTYRYKGLPPGPIGLVGLDSMQAALNPIETNFLYFVSMGNGYHKFSNNLEEHNKAVLKYQINAR